MASSSGYSSSSSQEPTASTSSSSSSSSSSLSQDPTLVFRRREFHWPIPGYDKKVLALRRTSSVGDGSRVLFSEVFEIDDVCDAGTGTRRAWTVRMHLDCNKDRARSVHATMTCKDKGLKTPRLLGHLEFSLLFPPRDNTSSMMDQSGTEKSFFTRSPKEQFLQFFTSMEAYQNGFHCRKAKDIVLVLSVEYSASDLEAAAADGRGNSNRRKSLTEDLARLVGGGSLTDFIVFCRERSFLTYKTLLAARSDVFRTMFEGSNKTFSEVASGHVRIDDVDPEVMGVFLRFIEHDKVDASDLDLHYQELFRLAHRYSVRPLQAICLDHAKSVLDVDGCLGAILFWTLFDDCEEVDAVVNRAAGILSENIAEVASASSGRWKELDETSLRKLIIVMALFKQQGK